jgi:hypothetical protein
MIVNDYNDGCDSSELPIVDFSQYTLLGAYTCGGGCSVDFTRKVFKNTSTNSIIYEVEVNYKGLCKMLIFSWN